MAKFEKGGPKLGGRKKGVQNRTTVQVREMIHRAIELNGGVDYFCWAAKNEPRAFLALAGKCIPQAIEARIEVEHKYTVRDFTTTGEINGDEENQQTPEVIEVESVRIEEGSGTGSDSIDSITSAIPIEAIDRGTIPVAVSRKS